MIWFDVDWHVCADFKSNQIKFIRYTRFLQLRWRAFDTSLLLACRWILATSWRSWVTAWSWSEHWGWDSWCTPLDELQTLFASRPATTASDWRVLPLCLTSDLPSPSQGCSYTVSSSLQQGRRSSGVRGLEPWKYVGGVRLCFDPLIMSHSFIENCCWMTLQVSFDLCRKWKVKVIFLGAYMLSGTGIVKCLEILT